MMKDSRYAQLNKYQPSHLARAQPGCGKSNISSLKAILSTSSSIIDQGRVPLAQYINEKTTKTNGNQQTLTYFEYSCRKIVS